MFDHLAMWKAHRGVSGQIMEHLGCCLLSLFGSARITCPRGPPDPTNLGPLDGFSDPMI